MPNANLDLMKARLRSLGHSSVERGSPGAGLAPELGGASRALQVTAVGDEDYHLRLRALLYTHWAHAMGRFRDVWFALRHEFVSTFELVHQCTGSQLDGRISSLLCTGIEDFSQFLRQFEVFLLQFKDLDILPEERLLSAQDFLVELADFCRRDVEVSNVCGSAQQLSGAAQGIKDGTDGA